MKKILIAGITFYRRWISPMFPGSCRFYPTCSAYAMEAVDRYGALGGSARAVVRILKCHPWHPGGFDPVSKVSGQECRGLGTPDEGVVENRPSGITRDNIASEPRALHT